MTPGVEDLREELDAPFEFPPGGLNGLFSIVADGHVVHADGSTDIEETP